MTKIALIPMEIVLLIIYNRSSKKFQKNLSKSKGMEIEGDDKFNHTNLFKRKQKLRDFIIDQCIVI